MAQQQITETMRCISGFPFFLINFLISVSGSVTAEKHLQFLHAPVQSSIHLKVIYRHAANIPTLRKIESRSQRCLPHLGPQSVSSKVKSCFFQILPAKIDQLSPCRVIVTLVQLTPSSLFVCSNCIICTILHFGAFCLFLELFACDLSQSPFRHLVPVSQCLPVKMNLRCIAPSFECTHKHILMYFCLNIHRYGLHILDQWHAHFTF